eukprot:jgi/Bigna1/141072/aug1.60_g15780
MVGITACVRFNSSSISTNELQICAETNTTLQRSFAPTITLSGFGIVSSGQDVILTADINHHLQSKNNSLSAEDISSFSYLWAISRLTNSRTGRSGRTIDLSETLSSKTTVLRIPTHLLEPAESYQISFEANMTKVYGVQRGLLLLSNVLETSARPPVAMIKGVGDFQEIPANSLDLYLDAGSASYDPEEAKNATKIFEWSCTNHTAQQPCSAVQISANGDVFSIPSLALRYSTRFPSILNITGLLALTANRISRSIDSGGSVSGNDIDNNYRWVMSSSSGAATLATTASLELSISELAAIRQEDKFTISASYVDAESQSPQSSVTIKVVDAPVIASIRVQPLSGTAYTTTFDAEASIVISDPAAAPILMSFAYFSQSATESSSKVLCPFSLVTDCKFTLPPGDHILLIGAKDVLGGVSYSQFGPVRVLAQQYPSFAQQTTECLKTSQAVFLLRQMVEEAYPAFHVDYHSYGLRDDMCRSLNSTLANLWDLGDVTNMLSLSRLAMDVIDEIPRKGSDGGDISLSECPDYAGALATTPTNTTISYVVRAASMTEFVEGEMSLLVAETLRDSSETQTFQGNEDNTEESLNILDAIETITNHAEPERLASNLGHVLADGYSAMVKKANFFSINADSSSATIPATTTTTTTSSCALLNQTLASMDVLLQRAGSTSPPQSNTGGVQYTTSAFDATTGSIFADEAGGLNASSSFRVTVDPTVTASTTTSLSSPGEYERAQSVLTLLRLGTASVSSCRHNSQQNVQQQQQSSAAGGAGDGFVFASPDVASVNLYNASGVRLLSSEDTHSSEDAIANVTIALTSVQEECNTLKLCRFWDTVLQTWSGEGCVYNGISSDGAHLCVCNHLTEFTLLADQVSCTSNENNVEAGYWVLIGVFVVIAGVALVQVGRMGAGGFKFKICVWTHILIIAFAIVRIFSVLMVARLIDGFEHARMHFGISLGIITLPYYIGFTLYCLIVFQWASVIHNARLSKNPFEQFQKRFILTSTLLGGSVLVVGLLFYLLDLPPYVVSSIIVGLSLLLMVAYLLYGMLLASKVSSSANADKAATAHRFQRLVLFVTIPIFLSCCCSIAMLFGREIYTLYLFALFCDACALAVIIYMIKGKVNNVVKGSSGGSSMRRRRGKTHRSSQDSTHSRHSRHHSRHESQRIGRSRLSSTHMEREALSRDSRAVSGSRLGVVSRMKMGQENTIEMSGQSLYRQTGTGNGQAVFTPHQFDHSYLLGNSDTGMVGSRNTASNFENRVSSITIRSSLPTNRDDNNGFNDQSGLNDGSHTEESVEGKIVMPVKI